MSDCHLKTLGTATCSIAHACQTASGLPKWLSRGPKQQKGFENVASEVLVKQITPQKRQEEILLQRIQSIHSILADELRIQLARFDSIDGEEAQNSVNLYAFIGDEPISHCGYLGLLKACTCPLRGLKCTTVIVHCYLALDIGQTYSYDPNGIHTDPNPNPPKKHCVDVSLSSITKRDVMNQVMKDLPSEKWMENGGYSFTDHNCCHWVDLVLASLRSGGVEFYGYSLS